MSKVYIATQGVGELLAGDVVTGLSEERAEELELSGALVVEDAEDAKVRKALAKAEEAAAAAKAEAEEAAAAAKAAAKK